MVAELAALVALSLAPPPPPCASPGRPGAGAVLIVFRQVGGVAGVNDRVTIRRDGRGLAEYGFLHPRHRRIGVSVPCAERRAIVAALARAGFGRLPQRSTVPPYPDAFEYSIAYAGRSVTRTDADRLSSGLREAIRRLRAVLARAVSPRRT